MKKIALTIAAAVFVFASCQNTVVSDVQTVAAESKALVEGPTIARINGNDVHESKGPNSTSWYNNTSLSVKAVEGSVNGFANMYSVTSEGLVYVSAYSGRWYRLFGMTDAVDVTSNGNETYAVNSAGSIFKLNQNTLTFDYHTRIINKKVDRIDVDTNGDIWAIADGDVYKITGTTATLIFSSIRDYGNALPQDIGCANGEVYLASAMYGIGSGMLYKYDGASGTFIYQNTGAHKVDVDMNGTVYIINLWGELYKKSAGSSTWVSESELNEIISDIGA